MFRRFKLAAPILILSAFLLVLAAFRATAQPPSPKMAPDAESEGTPRIVAVEQEHDFGQVEEGVKVTHVFTLRNEGDAPLKIIRAKGSWGCTASVVSDDLVPPGGETQITTTVNTENRSGHQSKKVTVTSNDPENPTLELRLKLEIMVDVEVKPRHIYLGQLMRGESASAEFSLKPDAARNVKILSVATDDERFAVEHLDGDPAGESRYRMDFAGSEESGNIMAKLLVRYTGSEEKQSETTISANILEALRYPKVIQFVSADGAFPPRRVTIAALHGESVRIEGIEDPDGRLNLQVLQAEGNQAIFEASVANPDGDYSTPTAGTLVVKTNHPELDKLEISYRIFSREPVSDD